MAVYTGQTAKLHTNLIKNSMYRQATELKPINIVNIADDD